MVSVLLYGCLLYKSAKKWIFYLTTNYVWSAKNFTFGEGDLLLVVLFFLFFIFYFLYFLYFIIIIF